MLIGVAAVTLTNTTNSMMQLSAEPAMRGRVMALRWLLRWVARRSVRLSWGGSRIGSGRGGRLAWVLRRGLRLLLWLFGF